MTATIQRVSKTTFDGSHGFHTLHNHNRVFTVQKNGPSIAAFRNKEDAIRFGKLLESHFDITHTWPVINFDDKVYLKAGRLPRLRYIDVNHWEDEEDLKMFCVTYGFSLLDIHRFENGHKLVGRAISWEVSPNFYIDVFNSRLV